MLFFYLQIQKILQSAIYNYTTNDLLVNSPKSEPKLKYYE
jgi:hypothetical protein